MANWIHDIEIKNFKSIRHQKIEDCRRVNVFIGYPNVGKSNVLEALSLFTLNENSNFDSLIRLENNTTFFFNGNIEEPSYVFINKHFYCQAAYFDGRIDFVCGYSSNPLEDNLSHKIVTDDESYFDFSLTDRKLERFRRYNLVQKKQLPILKKYEFSKKVDYYDGSSDRLIQPFGNNIFEVISSNESIRKNVSELFKSYDLKFSFDKSTRSFKILKTIGEDIFLIPYSMIADTLQRMIFYKAAILSNRDTVVLFEEPEAHMFPPYISKFTADVMYDECDNQFFIATHSPFVLNDFMENLDGKELAIYAVGFKKETGETLVRRLADEEITEVYQYGIDLFFNLENYLKNAV